MSIARLTFCTLEGNMRITMKVEGIATLEHAVSYGHHRAAQLSIEEGAALYLSEVVINNRNFACLPDPEFYAHGVQEISRQG